MRFYSEMVIAYFVSWQKMFANALTQFLVGILDDDARAIHKVRPKVRRLDRLRREFRFRRNVADMSVVNSIGKVGAYLDRRPRRDLARVHLRQRAALVGEIRIVWANIHQCADASAALSISPSR